jgi:formylglycine-generating enzyme required for sulfatase activity
MSVWVTAMMVGSLVGIGALPEKKPVAPVLNMDSMVPIAAGSFAMGVPMKVPGPYGDHWFEDQTPQRTITLSEFYMDSAEVTVADFALFLSHAGGEMHFHDIQPIERVKEGYLPVMGEENAPMRGVTWQAAAHYCAWAGKRLPTEAEWERAAAGSEGTAYPWPEGGAKCARSVYFTGSVHCEPGPVEVGSRPVGKSAEGLADMAGNVAEWVADWYDYYRYEDGDDVVDPTGPSQGVYRVVRGGGYLDGPRWIRTYARVPSPPGTRSADIGFRCAWSEGTPADGLRGTLSAPADTDREPSPHPFAPSAPTAILWTMDLEPLAGLERVDDHWYVLDPAAGELIQYDSSGAASAVVTGMESPLSLTSAGDRLLVADSEAGAIVEWTSAGGTHMLVVSGDAPSVLVADAEAVVWGSESVIHRTTWEGDDVVLATGIQGLTSMALVDSTVVFAAKGNAGGSGRKLATVSMDGGAVTVIGLANDEIKNHDPAGLVVMNNRAYTLLTYQNWPYHGFLVSVGLNGAALALHQYSPPRPSVLRRRGEQLIWGTRDTIVQAGPDDSAYTVIAAWARPDGLWVDSDGSVYWSDVQRGRILQVATENLD